MAGPFAVACVLLAVGGGAKAWRPTDTARALALFGWPVGSGVVRVGGVVEAGLALTALVTGSAWMAAAVAISYSAFAGWIGVALLRGLPISSCGCFGTPDTPPSVVHVIVNVVAAAVSADAAVSDVPALGATLRQQPAAGLPFLGLAALATWLLIRALRAGAAPT